MLLPELDNHAERNMKREDRPQPSISVVIPLYNRADTIRYCIDSVLSQTYPVFEVLVVDDGSDDSSVETVRTYSDSRIRCIEQDKHGGAQAARNRGILEASGDWIAFLDSDDEWLPGKLERQVEVLKANNYDPMTVVHGDCIRHDETSGTREVRELPIVEGDRPFARLLLTSGPLFPAMLTSAIALRKIGLLDEQVPSHQEWDMAIRLAEACRFIHIREPLFIYHVHGSDTISKNRRRNVDGYRYITGKYKNEIIRYCGKSAYHAHVMANALNAVKWGTAGAALDILQKEENTGFKILYRLYCAGAGYTALSLSYQVMRKLNII